jgi:thiamine biosynthesis lipoprotein
MAPAPPNPELITTVSYPAMATEFAVLLSSRWADRVEIALDALQQLDEIEHRLTVYRPESEVSRVNRFAAQRPQSVSPPTYELIEQAILWSQRTRGAFDITTGPLVNAWGFTTRSGQKPSPDQIEMARACVGYSQLRLSPSDRSIEFLRHGMSINMGAIGKGDALDKVAGKLREHGITDFLIHGGQSSLIAAGNQSTEHDLGWAVGISHPTKPRRRLRGIWLKDMALGTSGSGKQFFHHRGKRFGHVIDPRTGYPAGDHLSLTVLMPSATDADACATGLFVMSPAELAEVAEQDWFPPLVAVKQAARQDEVELSSQGEVPWVEPL